MIAEILKAIEHKKAVIGKQQVLKGLKSSSLSRVFLAKNAPQELVEDVKRYASLSGTEVTLLEAENSDLGTQCRKPYSISAIGILK